jgi:GNAT superfamily N-acetyltransferase
MSSKISTVNIHVFTDNASPASLLAAPIAYDAWKDQLPDRTEAEIDYLYGDFACDTAMLEYYDGLKRVNTFGTLGRLGKGAIIAAYAAELPGKTGLGKYVGYAEMRNFRAGNWTSNNCTKRQLPLAWLREVNVLPEYQGHGIGSAMIAGLATLFKPGQTSTVNVLEENQRGLRYFATLGYPSEPFSADEIPEYFGPGSTPAKRLRLAAPLAQVARLARDRSALQSEKHGLTFTYASV